LREWLEARGDQPIVTIDAVAQLALRWGIEIGENTGDLLDWFGGRILPEQDLEHAKSLIDASINLATPQRILFWEAMANITRNYPAASWQQFTGELYLVIGGYYLNLPAPGTIHIHIAGEYLQNAKVAFGGTKKIELQKLLAEWEKLAKETPVIRKYLEQFDESKEKRLKELLKGKKVVFVGGETMDFNADRIARQLGFASGEHVELDHEKGNGLSGLIKRINQGKIDYIVDMISFAPHHNELKNACQKVKFQNKDFHYIIFRSRSRLYLAFRSAFFEYHKLNLQND
jgi:hypothetical protein